MESWELWGAGVALTRLAYVQIHPYGWISAVAAHLAGIIAYFAGATPRPARS